MDVENYLKNRVEYIIQEGIGIDDIDIKGEYEEFIQEKLRGINGMYLSIGGEIVELSKKSIDLSQYNLMDKDDYDYLVKGYNLLEFEMEFIVPLLKESKEVEERIEVKRIRKGSLKSIRKVQIKYKVTGAEEEISVGYIEVEGLGERKLRYIGIDDDYTYRLRKGKRVQKSILNT